MNGAAVACLAIGSSTCLQINPDDRVGAGRTGLRCSRERVPNQ